MSTIEPIGDTYELPMRVDVHNSAQNAFVQAWLSKWEEEFKTKQNLAAFYHLPIDHIAINTLWLKESRDNLIESVVEDIQGTYDFENHGRNSHTFSDKFPTIYDAQVRVQDDEEESGYGSLRVSGHDRLGRQVWIEIQLIG